MSAFGEFRAHVWTFDVYAWSRVLLSVVRVGVVFRLKALFVERGVHLGFQLVWGWHQTWADQSVRPHVLSCALVTPRIDRRSQMPTFAMEKYIKHCVFWGGSFFLPLSPIQIYCAITQQCFFFEGSYFPTFDSSININKAVQLSILPPFNNSDQYPSVRVSPTECYHLCLRLDRLSILSCCFLLSWVM